MEELNINKILSREDKVSNIKEIPSKAHYKSVFYSLGCLMVDCLLFKITLFFL